MPGKRHYRDDEEPENEFIDDDEWRYEGCEFCGETTHSTANCHKKPLPKVKRTGD